MEKEKTKKEEKEKMKKEKQEEKQEKEKVEEKKVKKEIKKEEKETKAVKAVKVKREIVVPGEVVGVGPELLPGEGTQREEQEIVSIRFGLLEQTDKLIKVIPIGGVYVPRRGNTIVGQIIDITFNGWVVDIGAPHLAFLPVAECFGRIDKRDLSEHFTFRDIIVTKIKAVKRKGIDVTMKERGLKKLEGGIIIRINPTRVPRIIGRAGSMVNTIKKGTDCMITVGQNGVIWIKGATVDDELLAKEAIELIAKKPFIEGLTEQIKIFLEKSKKK